jgi:ERCC4-type nuclease
MRHVTVEIDSREKNPLLFPKNMLWYDDNNHAVQLQVSTVTKTLPFGDYRLRAYPREVVIERKAGVDELAQNLQTADSVRFQAAFKRFLEGCTRPVLLLDCSLAKCDSFGFTTVLHPASTMSAFWRMVLQSPKLLVLWAGNTMSIKTRTSLGAQLIRLMLSGAELSSLELPPEDQEHPSLSSREVF